MEDQSKVPAPEVDQAAIAAEEKAKLEAEAKAKAEEEEAQIKAEQEKAKAELEAKEKAKEEKAAKAKAKKKANKKATLAKKFKLSAFSKVVPAGSCNGLAAQQELAAEFGKHLLSEGKIEIESHIDEKGVTTKYLFLTK